MEGVLIIPYDIIILSIVISVFVIIFINLFYSLKQKKEIKINNILNKVRNGIVENREKLEKSLKMLEIEEHIKNICLDKALYGGMIVINKIAKIFDLKSGEINDAYFSS
jgi:hypothetical protein